MDQLKAFLEKAKTDDSLMAKINEMGKKKASDEEIIALAAEYEFTITKEEIEAMKNQSCSSCKSCEIGEEDLENIAGGSERDTQNRYDPNVCPNLTRTRFECVGFWAIVWCDHYRKTQDIYKPYKESIFIHECVMGAFNYKGYGNGNPE